MSSVKGSKALVPTPRELKLIVNQTGALYCQWGDQISLLHLTYFVLLTRWADIDIGEALVAGDLPDKQCAGILERGVEKDIATIWFGCDPKKSEEHLLSEPIVTAIESEKYEQLRKLAELHEGFPAVFDSTWAQSLTRWSEEPVLLNFTAWGMAYRLHKEHLLPKTFLSKFYNTITERRTRKWTALPRTSFQLASAIDFVRYAKDRGHAKVALRRLREAVLGGAGDRSNDGISLVGELIFKVEAELDFPCFQREDDSVWEVAANFETLSTVVGGLARHLPERKLYRVVKPRDAMAVEEDLASLVAESELDHRHALGLMVMHERGTKVDSDEVVAQLYKVLDPQEDSDPASVFASLRSLAYTGHSGWKQLRQVVSDGLLAHHVAQVEINVNSVDFAFCCIVQWIFEVEMHGETNYWRSPSNNAEIPLNLSEGYNKIETAVTEHPDELREGLRQSITEYPYLAVVYKSIGENPKVDPIICATLDSVSTDDEAWEQIDLKQLAAVWLTFSQHGFSEKGIFDRIKSIPGLGDEVQSWGFDLKYVHFYLLVMRAKPRKRMFAGWLLEELQGVSESEWLAEIEERTSTLIRLLAEVCDYLQKSLESLQLRTALRGCAERAISEDDLVIDENVKKAVAAISPDLRSVVRDEFFAILCEHRDDVSDTFLRGFGPEVVQSKQFLTSSDTVLELLEPAVQSGQVGVVGWVVEGLSGASKPFKNISKEYLKTLLNTIKDRRKRDNLDEQEDAHLGELKVLIESSLERS